MKKGFITEEKAKEILRKNPGRKIGRWAQLCDKIIKAGKPWVEPGLTRGQAWSLKRTAENRGLTARVIEKGTAVLISPKKSG